jgi:hypothetical protein
LACCLQHWRCFLQEVTQELLTAEVKEAQQQAYQAGNSMAVTATAAATKRANSTAPNAAASNTFAAAAAAASKACKWCGGGRNPYGEAGACAAAFAAAAPKASAAASVAAHAAGVKGAAPEYVDADSSPSGRRIAALVDRYSYMTKYVALLNPGEDRNVEING